MNAQVCSACGSALLLKNRYRALQPLGRGSFGRTYLARDESLPSRPFCVVKAFHPQAQEPDLLAKAVELFEQEAIQLDRLGGHPRIPELLAYFSLDQRQYLVQKYVDGAHLSEELQQQGCFDEAKIRQLLLDILPVLDYIHTENVIHRDIKPKNIIRQRGDQSLYLVDFGAAKYVRESGLFRTGTVIGSGGFSAPEQMMGRAVFASDLYGLGTTCLYLLTGVAPAKLFDVRANAWVWRTALRQPLSEGLLQVLDRLVQRLPGQRYATAHEALEAVQALGGGGGRPASEAITALKPALRSLGVPGGSTSNQPRMTQLGSPSALSSSSRLGTPKAAASPSRLGSPSASGSGRNSGFLRPAGQTRQPDAAPWPCRRTLMGHDKGVRALTFTADGRTLISASRDGTVRLWDLSEILPVRILLSGTTVSNSQALNAVALWGSSLLLAAAGEEKVVKLWQLPGDKPLRVLGGLFAKHSATIDCVVFHPDGTVLASASEDKTIKLWQVESGKQLATLTGHGSFVRSVVYAADGRYLVSGSWDNTVKIWNAEGGEALVTLYGPSSFSGSGFNTVQLSPDGAWLAAGSENTSVQIWQFPGGEDVGTLTGHKEGVRSLAFSPDGQWLATGDWSGVIHIWDTASLSLNRVMEAHEKGVSSLAFSPDSTVLASGSRDQTIKLWQVQP
ncbi:MAG: serine/threonine protein kinase [Gloeomargaritaceae cyanobacterium C42_A2020_066]|nr:serine/threonine protein kinase [Gloeomargaritaceae cyanobacterium C42_A2020_066]